MKLQTIVTFFLIEFGFGSCINKMQQPTSASTIFRYDRSGMVNFISSNKSIVTLSSMQTAENQPKAIEFAEINALENLLFKGVSGSSVENPIISDEVTAQKNSHLILKGLIFERGYKLFLTDSYTLESNNKNGATWVNQSVTFDTDALRKFLEKNEVIKKFGF